jgi:hypothetical protein
MRERLSMDVRQGTETAGQVDGGRGTPASVSEEFVRFCYHRRRVGWPELYDEMCAVAARGIFRGWGFAELAEQGIRFTLADLPSLAAVAAEVSREERERRRRVASAAKGAGGGERSDGTDERSNGAERPAVALRQITVGAD